MNTREEELFNACEYLQRYDRNGFYIEMWAEYKEGDISIDDVEEGLVNSFNTILEELEDDNITITIKQWLKQIEEVK